MKILQVITSLRVGGAEKLMVDLLPRFRNDGFDVDLLLLDGTDTPFKRQLENAGVRIFELGRGSVYNPFHIFRIVPYLKKYDIVHTHNFAAQLFTAIASVLCSVVLCTTEHNTSNRRRGWKWYRAIDQWMYRRYLKVICISKQAETNLKAHRGGDCSNVYTIYNGIDTQIFSNAIPSSEILSRYSKYKRLMMVSRFSPAKDQKTVIRAMTLLPQEYHLFLVGDGGGRPSCEALAKELNLVERVHFLGIRTDIPSLQKSSDVVIMSSYWEGFGLVVVEGMAARKPVIASDVNGLREIVAGAGILFKQGEAQDLASKILLLFEDKTLYEKTVNKCFMRAQEYDISKMVRGYEAIYAQLLDRDKTKEVS